MSVNLIFKLICVCYPTYSDKNMPQIVSFFLCTEITAATYHYAGLDLRRQRHLGVHSLDPVVGKFSIVVLAVLIRPSNSVPSSLSNVNTEPDNERSCGAQCKQKWEALPVVTCVIDDCLNDIRSNH